MQVLALSGLQSRRSVRTSKKPLLSENKKQKNENKESDFKIKARHFMLALELTGTSPQVP